jgi:hypothetical protein
MFNSREISSLRTFEMGHPALAAAAASSILALSAPRAVILVVSALFVSVRFSKVMSQVVSIDSGVMPRSPSWAPTAMLKQLAWGSRDELLRVRPRRPLEAGLETVRRPLDGAAGDHERPLAFLEAPFPSGIGATLHLRPPSVSVSTSCFSLRMRRS